MIWLLALLPLQDSWLSTFQASEVHLAAGDGEAALADLERCLELEPEHATTAYHLATIHARDGREDDAFDWLERAVDWGYADDAVIGWDPALEGLRDEPRFEDLRQRAAATVVLALDADVGVRWAPRRVPDAVMSTDGSRAVTESWLDTRIWNARTGDLVAVLDGRVGNKYYAYDPGGRMFAALLDQDQAGVTAWDSSTGRVLWEMKIPKEFPLGAERLAIRFTADGEKLILYNRNTGIPTHWIVRTSDGQLERRKGSLPELGPAPGSAPTKKLDLSRHQPSFAQALLPISDSVLALATRGAELRLIDVGTTRLLSSRPSGMQRIRSLHVLRAGSILAADGWEHTGFYEFDSPTWWTVAGGGESWPSPDGNRILVCHESRNRVFDLESGGVVLHLPSQQLVWGAAWSHDGDLLAVAQGTSVRIWDVDAQEETLPKPLRHPGRMYDVAFREGDRQLATACEDAALRVWDVASGRLLDSVQCRGLFGDTYLTNVDYAGDGRPLLAVHGGVPDIEARDPESLDLIWKYMGFNGGPNWLRFQAMPSGRLFCSGEHASRVLDIADGSLILRLGDEVTELVVSPSENLVFTVRDGALDVLDGRTLELRYTRIEYPDDGGLVFLPSLYYRGTPGTPRHAWLIIDGQAAPLEQFALTLYDPKRVAAGAAGIRIRPPTLESK